MTATQQKLIKVAHSPDSDDAFMFYAIKHKKIDLHGFEFEIVSEEIAKLNEYALARAKGKAIADGPCGDASIFAISFHAYPYIADKYQLLRPGASMGGKSYGPRVVSKDTSHNGGTLKIAIPGELTSAYLVWQLYAHEAGISFEPVFCSFDEVFDILAEGKVDASLLIHESQLKYQDQGCELIVDLGAWWYGRTHGLSMPLGSNVIERSLGVETIDSVSKILKNSIEYGLEHYEETLGYARKFSDNGLDDAKAQEYISMYVNNKTVSLGDDDIKSISLLYKEADQCGLFKYPVKSLDLDMV